MPGDIISCAVIISQFGILLYHDMANVFFLSRLKNKVGRILESHRKMVNILPEAATTENGVIPVVVVFSVFL